MQGGKLREHVELQSKRETTSDSGQNLIEWEPIKPLFADIRSVSGSEQIRSGKVSSQKIFKVFIRGFDAPEIDTSMRFKWGNRILNIIYPSEDRRHDRLYEILCMEQEEMG